MQLPKYDSYKDSGVEWIGEIPEEWDLWQGFQLFKENKAKNSGMVENTVLSLSYGRIIVKPEEKLHGLVPESFEGYQLIEPNDTIIRTTDLQNDHTSLRCGYAKDKGIITSAYLSLKPLGTASPKFTYYVLHAYDLLKVFYGMGSGLRQNLDFRDFKRITIPIPANEDQERIVSFLDQKTAEIDEAIAKKQKLIELLQEQKSILINQAVTKGLNPDAPMKDSGVEWIGEIPTHWEVKKLKHLSCFCSGGTPSKDIEKYWGGDIPWVSPKDMKVLNISSSQDTITSTALARTNLKLLPIGSLLIVVRGMILARKIPVAVAQAPLTINQDMKGLALIDQCLPAFILHYLRGVQSYLLNLTEESGHGTKTLPTDSLGGVLVPLPPKQEQTDIVKRINDVESLYAGIQKYNHKQIAALSELKNTLISSAVTGKIKV